MSNSARHQKFSVDEKYFDVIDTPNKAYLLGLLYADGNLCENNTLRISLQISDKSILEKMRSELKSTHPLKYIPYNSKNPNWSDQCCLSITNKQIHDSLISKGIVPAKSLILEFPSFLSKELYPHFIRGYFDGDGYISKNKKEKRLSIIGTEMFLERVKEITKNELDIHCSISVCHKKYNSTTRSLGIAGGKQVKKFLDWMYKNSDLYIERKHFIYKSLYCD